MQLSRDELVRAYSIMSTIRAFEEKVRVEFANGEIPGFVHLYIGEEASAAGVCMHLDQKDVIASTHRGHGHCIAKGVDVKAMVRELYAREGGLCNAKGGSMHLADLDRGVIGANGIVGGGAPHVCGAALTAKTLGTGGVGLGFIGDGASNQGVVAESMNLASVWRLPAIFVIEDNGYGEAMASGWATGGGFVERAAGFGMPGYEIDGFDFFAMHEAAREAIERARAGAGPSLLHVKFKRFMGHYEGDAQAYRPEGEVEELFATSDPLKLFRDRVTEAGLLEAQDLDDVDTRARDLMDEAVREAKAAPPPKIETLLTDVYVSY